MSKRHLNIAKIQMSKQNVANILVIFLRLFWRIKNQHSEEENTDYEKKAWNIKNNNIIVIINFYNFYFDYYKF